jgi:hypothetical protein
LGAPISAMKPQRVCTSDPTPRDALSSGAMSTPLDAFARQHGGCRGFLGRALAAAGAFR